MSKGQAKGEALRVRLDQEDQLLLNELILRSDLLAPEIVRKAIRLLYLEVSRREGDVGFLLSELSQASTLETIKELTPRKLVRLNDDPPKKAKA